MEMLRLVAIWAYFEYDIPGQEKEIFKKWTLDTISKISRELFKIYIFTPCLHLDGVGK